MSSNTTAAVVPGKFAITDKSEHPGIIIVPTRDNSTTGANAIPDGYQELLFVSFNTPTLMLIDDVGGKLVLPDEFEQRGLMAAVNSFDGGVARAYTLSVQTLDEANQNNVNSKHIIRNSTGHITLNEEAMVVYDRALSLANDYNVMLILPFIDHWGWLGGIEDFASLVLDKQASRTDFYNNQQVVNEFKSIVHDFLTRNNTITGVTYNSDPAILSWESGNELYSATDAWRKDFASYVKSVDTNHLYMDGTGVRHSSDSVLNDDNIDLLTGHYYPTLHLAGKDIAGVTIMGFIVVLTIFMTILYYTVLKPRWVRKSNTSETQGQNDTPVVVSIDNKNIDEKNAHDSQSLYPEGGELSDIQKDLLKHKWIVPLISAIFILAFLLGIIGLLVHRYYNPILPELIIEDAKTSLQWRKPFVIGEFGLTGEKTFNSILDTVNTGGEAQFDSTSGDNYAISGALAWSIRPHSRDGGYYVHSEMHKYFAYHYPGFNRYDGIGSGFSANERTIVDSVVNYNLKVKNISSSVGRNITIPDAPQMLWTSTGKDSNSNDVIQLCWRGSFGAESYVLEQSLDNNSTWTQLSADIKDAQPSGSAIYQFVPQDGELQREGQNSLYFRVRAVNSAGQSGDSNILPF